MGWLNNQRGIASASIILFGLLALTVVLINGISIGVQRINDTATEKGLNTVVSYCHQHHEKYPQTCLVDEIYPCRESYIFRSNCIGVGDVIYNNKGEFMDWCGYTSLDGSGVACSTYWLDEKGNDCLKNKNLCIKI